MVDNETVDRTELPDEGNNEWPRLELRPLEIVLDNENPRLNLPPNVTQSDIRRVLFEQEEVMKLIEDILDNAGLFPGEDVIVLKESDSYKVLEGNRRVCAVQCILDPSLAPGEKQDEIKELVQNSDLNLQRMQNLTATVAPSWEAAQKIITARHTIYQIKKWPYVSKWRRDHNQFLKTHNVDSVSNVFGEDRSIVIKNLKDYAYVRYIRDIPSWTNEQREVLLDNEIEVSPLQWHMSSEVQNMLGISFDSDYNLNTSMDPGKFEFVMKKIAQSIFLGGTPRITTRTDRDIVKAQIQRWMEEYANTNASGNTTSGSSRQTSNTNTGGNTTKNASRTTGQRVSANRRPEHYFSSLKRDISVNDPRLIRLTYELAKNDMKDRPAAGILLSRALIESALLYRIDKRNLTSALRNKFRKDLRFIDLSEILTFCLDKTEDLFQDSHNARQVLKKVQSDHREYMNSIVHGTWLDPSAGEIERIAGTTRELLRTILTDSP